MNVMELQAGRELDALVAEKVLGLDVDRIPDSFWCIGQDGTAFRIPDYSTDIAAAMMVWQHLRQSGRWCCLTIRSDYDLCWRVELVHDNSAHDRPTIVLDGEDSLPLAICRAALLAAEVKA